MTFSASVSLAIVPTLAAVFTMPSIFILAITAFAALAIGLAVFALMPRTSDISRRLATYGGGMEQNAKHILIFEQLMSNAERSTLAKSLQEAGWYKTSPAMYKAGQAGALAVGIVLTAVAMLALPGIGQYFIFLPILGYLYMPFKMRSAIKERKTEIQCAVPDFIDTLAVAVSAGVALNAAMINSVDNLPGALASEMKAALADIRMGRSRADALNAMAGRANQSDLSQLVTALVQSEKVGGNVSTVLGELAAEARNRRFSRAEELAAQLPIKMAIPMALLLLPSLIMFIMGPIAAGVMAENAGSTLGK